MKSPVSDKRLGKKQWLQIITNNKKEYERIVDLIETAETNDVVMTEVNRFLDHYISSLLVTFIY